MSPALGNSPSRASLVGKIYLSGCARSAVACQRTSNSTATKPMSGNVFDTNVLVYLASSDPVNADRAEAVI